MHLKIALRPWGANNLAHINIQNPISKVEKEVFEPLLGFKGTNEEFAYKAYDLIIKHKGLESAAPPLKLQPISGNYGGFSELRAEVYMDCVYLENFTHGDIINILSHELDHVEKIWRYCLHCGGR
jgi:hypothetical protein